MRIERNPTAHHEADRTKRAVAALMRGDGELARVIMRNPKFDYRSLKADKALLRKHVERYYESSTTTPITDLATWYREIVSGQFDLYALTKFYGRISRPLRFWPSRKWVTLFRQVREPGFYRPMTLYRGTTLRYARGLSWTPDQRVAYFFSGRWSGRRGSVFQVKAPVKAILATIKWTWLAGNFRTNSQMEYILDPSLLPSLKRLDLDLQPTKHDLEPDYAAKEANGFAESQLWNEEIIRLRDGEYDDDLLDFCTVCGKHDSVCDCPDGPKCDTRRLARAGLMR